MVKRIAILLPLCLSLSVFAGGVKEAPKEPVNLKYFYYVNVAGNQPKLMQELIDEFSKTHPDIKVEPIYSGNSDQAVQKAITAARGGNPPGVLLATSISLLEFLDMDLIEDIDQFMVGQDSNYSENYYQGFMKNSQAKGKTWSLPFSRSIPFFYWNKKHFKEAGLDPDKPPKNWDEVKQYAEKLVKRNDKGEVTRWGYEDMTEDTWTIQALILQAGGKYSNDTGTAAYFNTPETRKAFGHWYDLVNERKVMPAQRSYGSGSQDFVAETTSMMVNACSSFAFVANSAKFDFSISTLPGDAKNLFPTGGGNLFIFKGLAPAEKKAAWEFARWMTQPRISAKWATGTGYIPAHKKAADEQAMKDFIKEHPQYQGIASRLDNSEKEMSFYSNSQVRESLKVAIANALLKKNSIDDGLAALQTAVDKILLPYNKK